MSIILVILLSLIIIPITYQLVVFLFIFLALLTRTETNLQIILIALSDAIILYTTLIAALRNLREDWYIILKIWAIYCNHEYYSLIHLTYLYLLLNIRFPCLN